MMHIFECQPCRLAARVLLALAFCSITPALAFSATYYVSKSGSDGNSCAQSRSASSPRWSIGAGIACMSGGDTLIIGDGTYDEQIINTIPGGSPGAPTTLQAQNSNQAILRPSYPAGGWAVINLDESYITTDGLVADATNCLDNGGWYIRESPKHPDTVTNDVIKNGTAKNGVRTPTRWESTPNGILLNHGSTSHTIRNMEIFNNGDHGIYVPGAGNTIEGNRIYNNGGYGIHLYSYSGYGVDNNIVRNNVVHSNPARGVIIQSGSNNVFSDNLVHENGYGLVLGGTNQKAFNNTIYNNGSYCIWIQNGPGHEVKGNICYGNIVDSIAGDVSGSDISNNSLGVSTTPPASSSTNPVTSPTQNVPLAAPTDLRAECTSDGRNFTVFWSSVAGADNYYLRVDYVSNNNDGNFNFEQGLDYYLDRYNGTSFSGPVVRGQAYNWWVHGANAAEGIGPYSWGSFSCP